MITGNGPWLRRLNVQHAALGGIALLALLLRLYYVHTAVVIQPIRGDAVQYYSYAWNLLHHGVFSSAFPNTAVVVPDSFRDPGYPTFLALLLGTSGSPEAFIRHVSDVQCVLSAATVWMFAVLARRWAGFAAAIATGVLLALWPHTITLASYVLSETLLGFLVALALLATDETLRHGGKSRPLAAGFCFALAGLTNAVMAPFAPLIALLGLWRDRKRRRTWALVLIAAVLPLAAWSLRSTTLPAGQESSSDRAKMNLVQGAWPEYHAAYLYSHDNANAAAVMKSIDAEYDALRTNTAGGLGRIVHRLGAEPGRYAAWYLSKPLELWGWEIGIGAGDVYVYPTFRSPLLMQPILAGVVGALFFLAPFVLLFAAIGGVLALLPSSGTPTAMKVAVALAAWVTVVYGVLQSDARYSTPFRGLEVLLAAFAVHAVVGMLRRRRPGFANGRITS